MIDYNRPETWQTSEIHTPPSNVDVLGYQKKINKICGLTLNGKPTVLLSWAPDINNYYHEFCEWNEAGFGTKSWLRGTYKYKTIYDPNGNPIDVPPPRWVLKQWQSGAQYSATDDLTRWQKIEGNFRFEATENGIQRVAQQTKTRETRKRHPKEGRYIPMRTIRSCNGYCCAEVKKNGEGMCYGKYREPGEFHLETLALAVKIRTEDETQDPNAPISEKTLLEASIEAAKIEEQKRIESKKLIRGVIDEHYNEIIGIEPTTAYSLPNFKRSKSGLILPV